MEFGLYECVLKSLYRYIKYARHRDNILLHGRQRFQQTLKDIIFNLPAFHDYAQIITPFKILRLYES